MSDHNVRPAHTPLRALSSALLELKIILYTLIRNYTFALPYDNFDVDGYFFASLVPVVKGQEEKGGYMPLKVSHYEG